MTDESTCCPKCGKNVFDNQNSILCDACKSWVHLKCSGLIKKMFLELSQSDESYFCGVCLQDIFPFAQLKDDKLAKEFSKQASAKSVSLFNKILAEYNKTCSVCSKTIHLTKSSIPCGQCKHLIHKRCSEVPNWNIANIDSLLKKWECLTCRLSCLSSFPFSSLENHELGNLSYNSAFTCKCNSTAVSLSDFSHIEQLETCKLTLKEYDHLFDNDVDCNLIKLSDFDYYDNHEFHKLINSSTFDTNKMSSIFHTNISSISKNLENVEILMSNIDHKFDILAFSETWHTKDNDERIKQLNIEGFHNYEGQFGNNRKGGCGFFVAEHLSYSIRTDLNKSYKDSDCEFEAFWIEVENKLKANSIFGVLYNHPRKNTSAFLDYLQSIFAKINREKKLIFLCGDFNLNLLQSDTSPNVDSFLNLMLSNFFQPLILKPTRFNDRSAPSLIDNIFINSLEPLTVSGNLIDKISDHLSNFVFFGDQLSKASNINNSMYRDYRNFNRENYLQDARQMNFYHNDENRDSDINCKYEHFQTKFLELLNKHAPLKVKSKRLKRQQRKPWITKGILKSISTKNTLLKKFIKTKDDFWYERYRIFRNTLNRVIKSSKQIYYSSYFDEFKHDSKKVWKGINEILNKNKAKCSQDIKLNFKGKLISDNKQVANTFNHFFTNIAQKLADKLGPAKANHKDFLKSPIQESFFINPVNPGEVKSELMSLDESKSPDSYEIPISMVKCVSDPLSNILSDLINESFSSGTHPSLLKFAKVIPIFKAKSRLEVSNYRPISLLPIFNKIFEKLMHKRLTTFLDKHDVLFAHQFGFQKSKSTTQAILDLCNQLTNALNKKEISCCIFLDFAKAFDTVDHKILLDKLSHYGIRGSALNWFKSYLASRTQKVSINGTLSEPQTITHGVPQGSVLGPLLFLIYINDLPSCSSILKFHLFADDTSIFFSYNNAKDLESIVNLELKNVSTWLSANRLTLNVDKSNFLTISNKKKGESAIDIKIDNNSIKEKDYIKYLGVLIDNKLNWKQHTQYVNTKVSKGIGILAKMRHFVSQDVLRQLYHAFIAPHISYGLICWGSASKCNTTLLNKSLKKAVRIMNFADYRAKSKPLFSKLGLFNFDDLFKLEVAKFMYDINNNSITPVLCDLFQKTNARHNYKTRQATNKQFCLPMVTTEARKKFINFTGIKIWNQIPLEIRSMSSKKLFNKFLRKWLLQNC